MPDDETPDSPPDAGHEPALDPTPAAGTPSVAPEAGPGSATGPDDITSVVSATDGGTAPGTPDADATSVLAATPAAADVPGGDIAAMLGAATAAEPTDGSGPGRWASMNRAWVIAIAAAVVVLAGAGIALAVTSGTPKKHRTAAKPPTSSATNIPAPTGPACPLTGEPAPGGQVPQRPALAYKVDNYPDARPQSGVTNADVVFEEPVEGGITRLVVVFQCQSAGLVGPIRSARAIDVPILDQLSKPLFIHAGGINPVITLVQNGNLINDDVFTHASITQHVAGRQAPYNTYASTSSAWALNPTDTSPPAPLYTYSTTVPTGTAVSSVHIPFSGTNDNIWTWSPFTGQWLLSIGGAPANAANNGGRFAVPNVVVQTVHITLGPWLENSEGGLEVQAQLTGSGPLAVFRNGEEITGTWQRASLNDTTKLVAADGSTIALQPGKTWVELVPSTIPVTTKAATPAP